MKTCEENMTRIARSMGDAAQRTARPSAFFIGAVKAAGSGRLEISLGGLTLEPEDLWLAVGLDYHWTYDNGADNLLRKGDRVVLLSQDRQTYYLLQRMVSA